MVLTLESEKVLDTISWQILCALQENARISFAELGRRVGLSPPAVAERVQRLEDAGIITGYHAQVNIDKVGLPITAFIRISSAGDSCSRIGPAVKDFPEVLECHRVTGGDSAILKVVVSSVAHLEALIDRLTPLGTPTTSIVLSSAVTRKVITPAMAESAETIYTK